MTGIFAIHKLKNAKITNNSVILHKGKVVKESCVAEPQYQKYQKLGFRLKYFFPIFTNPRKTYILITDEWSKNYCHWLWESLSKLIKLKKESPKAVLVLPKSYLKIDFVIKSLEAFGFNKNNIKIIPNKSHLRVKNLAFIPCIDITSQGYYNFLKPKEVSKILTSHYLEKLKTNFGERIYISRSNPKKYTARQISNEQELTAMLSNHGFKTVYMENFSFLEQISIMNFAKYVIAPHGAGITNFMFSKPDCHLLELVNIGWQKTCFAEIAEKMSANYHRLDCAGFGEENRIELRNITVDVLELEERLIKILRSK
ncbi:MAG: glycosyltransferase family 61 protein [Pseudomonadota bacterium]